MRPKRERRWHDQRGKLSQVIDVLTGLPTALCSVIAKGINGRAETIWGQEQLKSMGHERILNLYKAQKKQRQYDQEPNLSKTIHYFYVLDEKNQDYLAEESVRFTRTMLNFVSSCQNHRMALRNNELESMAEIFSRQGPREVDRYVETHYPEFQYRECVEVGEDDEFKIRFDPRTH